METVNNINAVIYARYSSDNQTEQSIEGQVRVINDYAKRNNIPIINSYIDRAISGRRDDRPEFQQMISDAKKKNFGYVLVYKFDRFSRDRYNSLLYKRELKKCGVKVISVTEYISDDPQGILFESIIDGYSEFYSAELAQKVKRGNRESRLKGQYTGGWVPYGYKIENKKYLINEEEAAVVRKIFTDASNGVTFNSICNELNSQGLRHNGKEFNFHYISKLIKNEKYIGKVTVDGELFTNIVPAIISEELFEMASKNSKSNKARMAHFRPSADYLLSGKLYCGYCGGKYVGESGTGRNNLPRYYYKCGNKKVRKEPCESKSMRKEFLEDLVVDKIKTAILESKALEAIAENLCEAFNSSITEDPMLSANEKALQKTKKEIDNLMNAIKAGIFNEVIKDELDKLQEEKKQLEIEQVKLKLRTKNKLKVEDALSFLFSLLSMKKNTPQYNKMLIERFVRKVVLFNDRLEIELYPIDNHALLDLNNDPDDNSGNSGQSNNESGSNGNVFCIHSPMLRH